MPIETLELLSVEAIAIAAILALACLIAMVLVQGASLRRRIDVMQQEDIAAHATLRAAADRVARIEAETTPAEHDELRIAVPPDVSERVGELARRGGVSAAAVARAALHQGLRAVDADFAPNGEHEAAREREPVGDLHRPI